MTMHSSDVTAGNNAKALEYNNLRKDVRNGVRDVTTDNAGAFDFSTGMIQKRTLNGSNGTITFSNATAGQTIVIHLVQAAGGGEAVTWPTMLWVGGEEHVMSEDADVIDIVAVYYDGSDYFGTIVGQGYE